MLLGWAQSWRHAENGAQVITPWPWDELLCSFQRSSRVSSLFLMLLFVFPNRNAFSRLKNLEECLSSAGIRDLFVFNGCVIIDIHAGAEPQCCWYALAWPTGARVFFLPLNGRGNCLCFVYAPRECPPAITHEVTKYCCLFAWNLLSHFVDASPGYRFMIYVYSYTSNQPHLRQRAVGFLHFMSMIKRRPLFHLVRVYSHAACFIDKMLWISFSYSLLAASATRFIN